MTTDIAANLARVRSRIADAARAAGRDADGVQLVAVSKKQPIEAIRAAFAAGQRAFGESYAQELAAKSGALADLRAGGLAWHFVGHLQVNKARVVAPLAHVVHTVDSVVVARELGKRARARAIALPVLVEVNVGGEPQKAGTTAGELGEVLDAVRGERSLDLRGLMTLPPAGDAEIARRVFETLASLRSLHGGPAVLPELSMGMSDDLEIAVAAGATIVRVGTAIFGAR